jgi:hypothetical protein
MGEVKKVKKKTTYTVYYVCVYVSTTGILMTI